MVPLKWFIYGPKAVRLNWNFQWLEIIATPCNIKATNRKKHALIFNRSYTDTIKTMGAQTSEECVANGTRTEKFHRQIYFPTKSKYACTTRQCVVICSTFSMSTIFALARTAELEVAALAATAAPEWCIGCFIRCHDSTIWMEACIVVYKLQDMLAWCRYKIQTPRT